MQKENKGGNGFDRRRSIICSALGTVNTKGITAIDICEECVMCLLLRRVVAGFGLVDEVLARVFLTVLHFSVSVIPPL